MLFQVPLKQLEYRSTRISSRRNRTECFRSTRRIVWITYVCWWNRLSCRSDGSAVFRLVFYPRISSTQTGKSEATRPSRVCEPVPINGEPVVLYCGLASCAVRLSVGRTLLLAPYCQRARCTACFGEKVSRADDVGSVLSMVPLLCVKSYTRVTSAQNNRNIRLEFVSLK